MSRAIRRIISGGAGSHLGRLRPAVRNPEPHPESGIRNGHVARQREPNRNSIGRHSRAGGDTTPVAGTTTTQVNVRQEPLASGRVLGTLAPSASVQIFARDPASNWYQIAYEAGDDGKGWVAAQYVGLARRGSRPHLGAGNGPLASVREQINVRSGPGTQFDAVGC